MFNFQCFFNLFISSLYILDFIILLSLDNDVLETSKRRAMLCNILSQIFIVKCFTKSLLIQMTEWTRLISYLLYGLFSNFSKKNTIKAPEVIFHIRLDMQEVIRLALATALFVTPTKEVSLLCTQGRFSRLRRTRARLEVC